MGLLFFACSSDDDNSNTCNGTIDPQFFAELKESITSCSCETSILKGTYNNETVYYKAITDPLCYTQTHYFFYDCKGNLIKELSNEESNEYDQENNRTNEILYTCEKK
ncbi:hypothetical protein [Zunongwangia sp.]|uniref:hypothetical protein n=1 Tax=Zunongwangia sp. TaxID=1965325 RepID=UPI003AA7C595